MKGGGVLKTFVSVYITKFVLVFCFVSILANIAGKINNWDDDDDDVVAYADTISSQEKITYMRKLNDCSVQLYTLTLEAALK